MNQTVQFPDYEYWDEDKQAVCFPALCHGMQLTCAIAEEGLHHRYGQGEALSLFRQNRWDLEEEAERLIVQQSDDSTGWYWLS